MMLDENIKSVVSMEHIYFDHIYFTRSEENITKSDLKIRFSKSCDFTNEMDGAKVTLGCTILDAKSQEEMSGRFYAEISVVGDFSCEEPDPERRKVLLEKNTLAILFPYLRTQITILTAQPNMEPIVIPPINIDAMFHS